MVTGASTAELALILVDARHGVVEQTRRHLAVTGLLGVRHVALAVNKMDLVDWDETAYKTIVVEFEELSARFGIEDVVAVPVSALHGDNIVSRSERATWYAGPTLLEHLEAVPVGTSPAAQPLRLPVQYVVRPRTAAHPDYRGYAGRLTSGVVRPGDEVVVLPSGRRTTVAGIDRADATGGVHELDVAFAPQSVVLRLTDDIDIARGDLIAAADAPGLLTREITGTVAVLSDRTLRPRDRLLLRVGTRTVRDHGGRRRRPARHQDHAAPAGARGLGPQRDWTTEAEARRGGGGGRLPRPAPHRRLPADRRVGRLDPGRRHGRGPGPQRGRGHLMTAPAYPLALDLGGRRAVVVGGGPVAARRAAGLVAAGAAVEVFAPWASEDLREQAAAGAVVWHEREYLVGDLVDPSRRGWCTPRPATGLSTTRWPRMPRPPGSGVSAPTTPPPPARGPPPWRAVVPTGRPRASPSP